MDRFRLVGRLHQVDGLDPVDGLDRSMGPWVGSVNVSMGYIRSMGCIGSMGYIGSMGCIGSMGWIELTGWIRLMGWIGSMTNVVAVGAPLQVSSEPIPTSLNAGFYLGTGESQFRGDTFNTSWGAGSWALSGRPGRFLEGLGLGAFWEG